MDANNCEQEYVWLVYTEKREQTDREGGIKT